jgi:quercetin dioxygenase-like cupin family protein
MSACSTWPELIALDALGVLPAGEAERVRAHRASCASCAGEYRHDRAAADLLVYLARDGAAAIRPADPHALKERVLRAARAARAPSAQANALLDFAPGIRWAVTGTDNATLVRWVFEPPDCASIPDEVHTITQSGIVLEGSFSLLYGDGTRQLLRKQDVYSIPPGVAHGAEFHERTVLFDVYTPNHVEFEAGYRRQLLERAEVS